MPRTVNGWRQRCGTSCPKSGTVSGDALELPLLPIHATVQPPTLVSSMIVHLPVVAVEARLRAPTLVTGDALGLPLLRAQATLQPPTLVDGTEVDLPLSAVEVVIRPPSVVDLTGAFVCRRIVGRVVTPSFTDTVIELGVQGLVREIGVKGKVIC